MYEVNIIEVGKKFGLPNTAKESNDTIINIFILLKLVFLFSILIMDARETMIKVMEKVSA